ncbi:MAG: diaminopimelate epimerase [Prevotellaceae bacterium]|jgi:diaminopimelate epimerase|nr:diaminopimelate epimerase [Prevotellaceae bacterium]
MELFFAKYHGLGNDFVLVDHEEVATFDLVQLAKTLCERHIGIGADGLIVVKFRPLEMLFYNSDGSTAKMCGNGIRCLAHYLYTSGSDASEFTVKTGAGNIQVEITNTGPFLAKVNMGKPDFTPANIPILTNESEFIHQTVNVEGKEVMLSSVFMGTTHTVVFVDDINTVDIEKIGRTIGCLPIFPDYTNVNFVQVIDNNTLCVRTHERGVGPTLACGTGCCAAAVMANKLGYIDTEVKVELAMGTLDVEITDDGVYLQGPAVRTYDGNMSIEHLL